MREHPEREGASHVASVDGSAARRVMRRRQASSRAYRPGSRGGFPTRITTRRAEIFKIRYPATLRAFPGARELLARFSEDELRLVIATSSGAKQLNEMLEQTGLNALVDRKATSSDAEQSKPSPDIVEAALSKGGLEPEDALMLGDTPYDIQAASRAGVSTIALRCGGWPDRALAESAAIYDDPEHLLREYDKSPFSAR